MKICTIKNHKQRFKYWLISIFLTIFLAKICEINNFGTLGFISLGIFVLLFILYIIGMYQIVREEKINNDKT